MSGRRGFGGEKDNSSRMRRGGGGLAIRGRVSIKANQEGVGKVYRCGSGRKKEEEEEEETEEMRIDKEMGRS